MSLKQQREAHNWTQRQFAEAAGVDTRTVKRWEAEVRPSLRTQLVYRTIFDALDSLGPQGTHDVQDDAAPSPEPMNIAEVIQHRPDPLLLRGPLATILGSLPQDRPFSILLGGASGAGKSTVALQISQVLADHGAVLYCTSEERISSGTIGTRAEHAGVNDADLDVVEVQAVDDVADSIMSGSYNFCVIDSINELGLGPDEVVELMEEHNTMSWIFIAQADATEKSTVGGARWRHLVDIRLWCEREKDGRRIVKNLKNRFAPTADHLVLAEAKTLPQPPKKAKTNFQTTSQGDTMNDQTAWIISRLETDLASAQREVETLKQQLTEKDRLLREIELKVIRFEVEAELSPEEASTSLADNPEVIVGALERVAPFIAVVNDLIRTFRPQSNAAASPVQTQVPFSPQSFNPTPNEAQVPGADYFNTPIPGVV
ncbi:MAG: helix-turn-helix domain-containing protein [bacterium]|nr:helix-turn-helix domain-containing protein [bacterium]